LRYKRALARSRTRANTRLPEPKDRQAAPGGSTSQAVARSNSTLGCSALSQARVTKPAHQLPRRGWITGVAIAVDTPNLRRGLARGGGASHWLTGTQRRKSRAAKRIPSCDDGRRHVGRVAEKCTQEPNGGQLQCETQLVVGTAPQIDSLEDGCIEVKVSRQLLSGRRTDVMAVGLS